MHFAFIILIVYLTPFCRKLNIKPTWNPNIALQRHLLLNDCCAFRRFSMLHFSQDLMPYSTRNHSHESPRLWFFSLIGPPKCFCTKLPFGIFDQKHLPSPNLPRIHFEHFPTLRCYEELQLRPIDFNSLFSGAFDFQQNSC